MVDVGVKGWNEVGKFQSKNWLGGWFHDQILKVSSYWFDRVVYIYFFITV